MFPVSGQSLLLKAAAQVNQSGIVLQNSGAGAGPVNTAEYLSNLNDSVSDFYDLLIDASGEDYNFLTQNFSTVNNVQAYILPLDHYKERFTDLFLNGTQPNSQVPIQRYDESRRDLFWPGNPNLINGNQTITISYAPACPQFILAPIPTWSSTTAYSSGSLGQFGPTPANLVQASVGGISHVFECVISGTSGGSAPSWNIPVLLSNNATPIPTTTDNTIVWSWKGLLSQFVYSMDFINGFDQLVYTDTAHRILTKLQRTSALPPLSDRIAELKERIGNSAQVRDLGDAPTTRDVEMATQYPTLYGFPAGSGYQNLVYRLQGYTITLRAFGPV
jgi:hypothetical protein